MKQRVLEFVGSFHQGGSERQAVQLSKLLVEDGEFEVFIATLDRSGILLDEASKLVASAIPEFKLTSFYNANFFFQLRNCVRFIRKNKISIVHTHDFYTNVFGIIAARLAGVTAAISSKRETGGMRTPKQDAIEKWIFGRSSAVVVNSSAVRSYLAERGVEPARTKLIYNGLDLDRFDNTDIDHIKTLRQFGLPEDTSLKFVTLIANLRHTVKNHPMLLRAAKTVVAADPNAHFILAGEGDLADELKTMADQLGIAANVHFTGRCVDVPALLSISAIGVLTSFAEGFSNSLIEYMAAGLPVVATNVGGAAEVIEDGVNGYLVNSDDDKAFAERLTALLGDDLSRQKMGDSGRELIRTNFSSDSQLSKTKALYRDLLN